MSIFGKNWQRRLHEIDDYLRAKEREGVISHEGYLRVTNDLTRYSLYSMQQISEAVGIGDSDAGQGKSHRTAVRALCLVKLVVNTQPSGPNPVNLANAPGLQMLYLGWSEAQIESELRLFLTPVHKVPLVPKMVSPSVLKPTPRKVIVASTSPPPLPPPKGKPKVAAMAYAYDQAARPHIVLSGHGGIQETAPGVWPMTTLAATQEIRYYCADCYSLPNRIGQLIDNHQNVRPVETQEGPATIYDLDLLPKDSLTVLNHSKFDTTFITVTKPTPLSTFLQNPEYANAVFHWAACRVLDDVNGRRWDADAQRWKTWDDRHQCWV